MSITESVLHIALDHAEHAGAVRITAINLRLGSLSSLVDDSICFYWDIIAKDTIAEHAQLRFERIPAKAKCADCASEFPLPKDTFACPQCSGTRLTILAGDELQVDSIEIDTTPDPTGN